MEIRNDKKWKIYIVSHDEVFPEMYENDLDFGESNYEILNVGTNDYIKNSGMLREISQFDLRNSKRLGKWWAESEGIYNLWKNGLHEKLDFIGFIHYDIELRLRDGWHIRNTNITSRICKAISNTDVSHLSFETHDIDVDYNQRILADVQQPNVLQGEGLNCYDYILRDYNEYFGTSYNLSDLKKKGKINLCSCFLIDTYHFNEMMLFFEWVINKGELILFDTEHKYRIQGGLAERYFGIYMAFAYDKMIDLSLIHHWNDGLKSARKKYCYISRTDEHAGLFSFFNTTLGAIDYWKRKGYDVIVEESQNHQWGSFFECIEKESINSSEKEEIIKSNRVVEFRPDDSMEILCNEDLMKYWHRVYIENCKVKSNIEEEVALDIEKYIGDRLDTTIGVLCRGTDYVGIKPAGHPRQPLPEELFPILDAKLKEKYEYIYLVTEDEEIFSKFSIRYGSRLLSIPQKRVEVEAGEFLSDAVARKHIDIFERDKGYLIAVMILSKCKMLVAGRTSGTVAAMVISEGFDEIYLWDRGRYGDELEEKLKYKYK